MDNNQEQWIKAVRQEIEKSDFESDHRSALHRQIDFATQLLNGSPDKMKLMFESSAEKIVRDVRQEIRLVEEIRSQVAVAIDNHTKGCQFKRRSGISGLFDRLADQYPVMAALVLLYLIQSGYGAAIIKGIVGKL